MKVNDKIKQKSITKNKIIYFIKTKVNKVKNVLYII